MDRLLGKIALAYVKQKKKRIADWFETDQAYARQGFSSPCCLHGTSNWTDFDNICGPCEDGDTVWQSYHQILRDALRLAKSQTKSYDARCKWLGQMPCREVMPSDLRAAIIAWAVEPIRKGI